MRDELRLLLGLGLRIEMLLGEQQVLLLALQLLAVRNDSNVKRLQSLQANLALAVQVACLDVGQQVARRVC